MIDCTIVSVCESKRSVYAHAKDYQDKAVRLARSIRKNGGSCKDMPIHMWYGVDNKPDQETLRKLADLGCTTGSGTCEHQEYPVFNKITAMGTVFPTKYTMWFDSDIYVLGDFSAIFNGDPEVAAPSMNAATNKWVRQEDNHLWELFYKLFDISGPIPRVTTSMDGKEGNFYLCSGIVLFQTDSKFAELYRDTANRILESDIPDKTVSFSQTALSIAILRGKYTYRVIPKDHHLFYAIHDKRLPSGTVIVHYQDNRVTEIADADWNV